MPSAPTLVSLLSRTALVFGLALPTGGPLTTAKPAESTALPESLLDWTPGLRLLHASRVDEALAWFERRERARPDDPCGFYFAALVYTRFDVDGLLGEKETELGRERLERGILASRRINASSGRPSSASNAR